MTIASFTHRPPSQHLLWWLSEYPPDPGGIGTFASHVAPALADRRYAPTLLVCQGDTAEDISADTPTDTSESIDGSLRIVRKPIRAMFDNSDPTAIVRMRRFVSELKTAVAASVYHVHLTDPTPILHLATIGTAPAPTVVTLHNEFLKRFPVDDEQSLIHRLLSASPVIVCCSASNTIDNAVASPHFSHRIVTIPNGIPVEHPPLPLPNRPQLLAIGRLVEQKSFHRAIAAMPLVLERQPDAHLRIVGEGPERDRLEALIDDLGVGHAVTLAGHVDSERMIDEFTDAQIVVAPSVHEGLPYALLEAAMFGRPIVGTDIGGIRDVVTHSVNGTLVDPATVDDDPTELAEAVLAILGSDELALIYAAAGRRHIERHLSLDACVSSYEQVYQAAVQPRADLAVIIPAYNAERHLAATLDSVLDDARSSDRTVQILVVDDGSTDGTAALAAAYAEQGVALFSQPNLGGALARNAGLALTNSEFVAHFDSDDLWPAGRIDALLSPFEVDGGNELDAVFGHAAEFADDDAPPQAMANTEPQPVRMPTVGIIRRSVHDRFGGFVSGEHNDQLGWSSKALMVGLRYEQVEAVTLRRRIHATNLSHQFKFTSDTTRLDVVRRALAARRQSDQPGD